MYPYFYSEFVDLLGARMYWTIISSVPMTRCYSIIWYSRQCTNRRSV